MAGDASAVSVPNTSRLRITTGDFLVAGIPACAAGFFMALSGGASGLGELVGVMIGGAVAVLAFSLLFAYGSWLRARRADGAGRSAFRWTAIILASGSLFTSCSDLALRAGSQPAVDTLRAALAEYMEIAQGDGDSPARRAQLREAHERRLASRNASSTSTLDLTVPMAEAAWETSQRLLRFGESLEKLLALPGTRVAPARTADEVAAALAALTNLERDLESAASITADLPAIVKAKLGEAGVPERTARDVLEKVGTPSAAQIAEGSERWLPIRRYVSALRGWLGYLDTHRGRWNYNDGRNTIVFDVGLGAEGRKLMDTLSQAEAEAFGPQGGD